MARGARRRRRLAERGSPAGADVGREPGGGRHLTEFSRPQAAWEGILRKERGPWTDGGSEPRGARWRGRRTSNRRLWEVSVRRAVLQPEPAGYLPGTGDAAGGSERGRGARGGCGSGAAVQASGTSNHIPVASSDRREVTVAFPARVRSQCGSQHLPPPTDPGSGRSLEYQLSTNISAVFEEKGRCRSDVPVRRGNSCSELEDRSRRAATIRKIVKNSHCLKWNILSRCKLY